MVGIVSSSGGSMLTNGGGCIFEAIFRDSIFVVSFEGGLGFWGVIVVIISMVLFVMAQSSLSSFFFCLFFLLFYKFRV